MKIETMETFVINLERCEEKKVTMKKRLKDMDATFLKAVDGKKLNNVKLDELGGKILNRWKDPFSGRNMTWGEVGCALSHYNIYEKCINENIDIAIIFEDDCLIPDNFQEKLDVILNELGNIPDWEFCYLGRKAMDNYDKNVNDHFVKPGYSYWLCSYIINLKGMKKILDSGMKTKLIPVDEFLPLLGGVSPHKEYNQYYDIPETLNMYSLKNLICRPEPGAFSVSETEHTKEIEETNNDLLLLATGTDMTDGLKRFINSCNVYGLRYDIMGLGTKWDGGVMADGPGGGHKINFLVKKLETLKDDEIVLVTDSYDVIMCANSYEILDKYKKFNKPIVFATESSCWPDRHKASLFPKIGNKKNLYLNSGGFIGKVKAIRDIVKEIPSNSDDQRWYIDVFLSDYGKSIIALDYNCEIFQCMNDAEKEIEVNKSKSRIYNKITTTHPCHLHGNGGPSRKDYLNKLESYLMRNWNSIYGYNKKNNLELSDLKETQIYVHILNTNPTLHNKVLEYINNNLKEVKKVLPEMKYTILTELNENEALKKSYEDNVDYHWIVDTTYVLTYEKTLLELLKLNKGLITPIVSIPGKYWSNYWGKVDDNGWYASGFDYIDQVEHRIKGCWNVPHIFGNILINKEYIGRVQNYFTNDTVNKSFDKYMKFCYNCRKNDIFMYATNLNKYGYVFEVKDDIPPNALHKELYMFESNKELWEEKYLHPEFRKAINNWKNLSVDEPCKWCFTFPFVTELFCDHLLDEVNAINSWSPGGHKEIKDDRIGNTENIPTVDIHMKQIGFRKQWEKIIHTYISKLVSYIFSPFKTKGVNIAFVVKYEIGNQEYLMPHHDSSSYSLGITLNEPNKDFIGGGTRFIKQNVTVQGKKGYGTLHPGRLTHYHEGVKITKGTRYIFISFIN